MNQLTSRHTQVQGSVASGFEPVKALFEHEMRTMAERDAQLCVYHRGEKVVDLWASADGDGGVDLDMAARTASAMFAWIRSIGPDWASVSS